MKKLNRLRQAVREYRAGIVATRTIQRLVASLIAMCFGLTFLLGLLDAMTGWHLSAPAWVHAVGVISLAFAMTLHVIRHVKRMRVVGRREYLGKSA